MIYTLDYPNFEVKRAFLTFFTESFAERELSETMLYKLIDSLRENKIDECFIVLRSFFAGVKYDIQIAQEKYYQTIFYMIFLLLGVKTSAEIKTSTGRIDAVIELADAIFLFEFKLDGSALAALQQSKDKAYAEKYRLHNKPITLVGANFDYKARKITEWTQEQDQLGLET